MDSILSNTHTLKSFFHQFGPLAVQELFLIQKHSIMLISGYKISKYLSDRRIKRLLENQIPLIKRFKLMDKKDKGYKIRYGLSRIPIFSEMETLLMSPLPEIRRCESCNTLLAYVDELQKHIIPIFCNKKEQDSPKMEVLTLDHENSLLYINKSICGVINTYSGRISLLGNNHLHKDYQLDYFVAYNKALEYNILDKFKSLRVSFQENIS